MGGVSAAGGVAIVGEWLRGGGPTPSRVTCITVAWMLV